MAVCPITFLSDMSDSDLEHCSRLDSIAGRAVLDRWQSEQPRGVARRGSMELVVGDAPKRRQPLGDIPHVSWFVALAAIGMRRQEWAIGLDQQAIQRYGSRNRPQIIGIFVRDRP